LPANALIPSPLPLFPLSSVLYPDGQLVLRVFEVRYLDMIGQCLRQGRPFGVVALQNGHEVRRAGAPQERLHAVGTLAHITHHESAQAGLLHIVCQGGARFRTTTTRQLPHGLWVADAHALPPDHQVTVPDDLAPAAQELARWLDQFAAQGIPAEQWPVRTPWRLDDCGWVANRWCERLPIPLTTKQQLMELDNPLVRLELVSDLLAQLRPSG
jgi:Lon protease-like protein